MENKRVTTSKDIIKKYLEYLRDISRKIISTHGFEKALIDKSKNNRAFTIQIKEEVNSFNPSTDYYEKVKFYYSYLISNLDKKLFCGIGLICGKKNEKTFAAPILYLECNISFEQNSNEFTLDYDYTSINLNYDLFSNLFTLSKTEEDDDVMNIAVDNEFQIIRDIEKQIQEMQDNTNLISLTEYVNGIFLNLKEKLDNFKSIAKYEHDYNFNVQNKMYAKRTIQNNVKNVNKSIFELDLCYVDSIHLFVSQIPDQLSTYEALRMLIGEVEQHDFKNQSLEKLLINALTEDRVELSMNDPQRDLKEYYLPVSLSGPQKTALRLAWTKEISYIQGPPGTGKSHTISAIVISAVLNNKRVLVVSQKQPALKVVKEKVEPILKYSGIDDIQGMIYYDKDGKKKIRDHIRELTSIANTSNTLRHNITRTEELLKRKEKDLENIIYNISQYEGKLRNNLNNESEFKELNDIFLGYKKDIFLQHFNLLDEKYDKFKLINDKQFKKTILYIKQLYSFGHRTLTTNLYLQKYRNAINSKYEPPTQYLEDNIILDYCDELLELYDRYAKAVNKQETVKRNNNEYMRDKIRGLNDVKLKHQHDYIKLKYEMNTLKMLTDVDYIDELNKFAGMLWNSRASLIEQKMKNIDFKKIICLMPYWAAEIRHLGQVFPMEPDLFDLVIVDESSQVNIAEVVPAFYRAKHICIVGDHKQLSLNSTGINFSMNRSFDTLTWNKYKCNDLLYDNAKKSKLTVLDASILDFIIKDSRILIPNVMLDEHFRSMPAMADYTNKYYEDKLKIMKENPKDNSINTFISIEVPEGKRDPVSKVITEEADMVIDLINKITLDDYQPDLLNTYRLKLENVKYLVEII